MWESFILSSTIHFDYVNCSQFLRSIQLWGLPYGGMVYIPSYSLMVCNWFSYLSRWSEQIIRDFRIYLFLSFIFYFFFHFISLPRYRTVTSQESPEKRDRKAKAILTCYLAGFMATFLLSVAYSNIWILK